MEATVSFVRKGFMQYLSQFDFHLKRMPDIVNKMQHLIKVEFQTDKNDSCMKYIPCNIWYIPRAKKYLLYI